MEQSNNANYWFLKESDGREHEILYHLVSGILRGSSGISSANVRNMKLYCNTDVGNLSVSRFVLGKTSIDDIRSSTKLSLNVVQSCIDTLVSKLSKSRILPTFLTEGGSFEQQKKAKLLNRFIRGEFYSNKMDRLAPRVLKDACIFGTGIAKVYTVNDKITIEKVFPDEIIVDPQDGYYGNPRAIYQVKFIPRHTLRDMFPKFKQDIDVCASERVSSFGGQVTEVILVVEGWYLGNSETAGKHVICCEGVTLFKEEWKRSTFPFAFLRYNELPLGFFGQGISEQLTGIQQEINRLVRHQQACMKLIESPRYLVPKGSDITANQLTNGIGDILYYTGEKPEVMLSTGITNSGSDRLDYLYNKAFEITGISQMSATSRNVMGANTSGRALRTIADIETERFMITGQLYQQLHVDIAYLVVQEAEDAIRISGNYKTMCFDKLEGIEKLNYKDFSMGDEDFVIQCFPTSALPHEPAARLETVQEMLQAGLIDPELATDLLDYPDLESSTNLKLAPTRLLRRNIERMLEDGEYIGVEDYDDLQRAIQLGVLYYNKCRLLNYPESTLSLLRRYIDEAKRLLDNKDVETKDNVPITGLDSEGKPILPEAPVEAPQAPVAPAPLM